MTIIRQAIKDPQYRESVVPPGNDPGWLALQASANPSQLENHGRVSPLMSSLFHFRVAVMPKVDFHFVRMGRIELP